MKCEVYVVVLLYIRANIRLQFTVKKKGGTIPNLISSLRNRAGLRNDIVEVVYG